MKKYYRLLYQEQMFGIIILEHLISWVGPNFFERGEADNMNKKDSLISSLLVIIL